MKLNKLDKSTTWGSAVDVVNNNNESIILAIDSLSSKYVNNKGYFTTYNELLSKHSFPKEGDVAFVGDSYPGLLYCCKSAGIWTNSNKAPIIPDQRLSDYLGLDSSIGFSQKGATVLKDDLKAIIDDKSIELLDGSVTPDSLSESTKQLINSSGGGSVTNLADDEDLVSTNNVLKFKDKAYQPSNFSGLGRKILRKNIDSISGKNILTQAMINMPNTIYDIRYDYDLNGATINIPEGCVIEYSGGSINNGKILYGNKTTSVNKTGIQKGVYYLEDFVDYNDNYNPAEMRDFIQRAINYTHDNGSDLIFPKDKTFIVEILPNPNVPENQWGIKAKDGTWAVSIPSNINIDLNGSTIQAATNKFAEYHVVIFNTDCVNSKLMNGSIIGDRDTHIIPAGSIHNTHEWNLGVYIRGNNISLENVRVGKVRGDSITVDGNIHWNHPNAVKVNTFTAEYIDSNGAVHSDNLYKLSPYINIKYIIDEYDTILIKPVPAATGNFNIEPFLYVHYYDDANRWLGYEKVFLGDLLRSAQRHKASKIRFYIEPISFDNLPDFWMTKVTENFNVKIINVEVFEAGRNGINPTVAKNILIQGCHVHDIGGTNNQVGIDIEGNSYLDGYCTIKDTLIERCGSSSITLSQGSHIVIDNCTIDSMSGSNNDVLVINCIVRGNISLGPKGNELNFYPKRIIQNSRIYGSCYVYGGIVDNCIILDGTYAPTYGTSVIKWAEESKPVYKRCNIYKKGEVVLTAATYSDCSITGNIKLIGSELAAINFINCAVNYMSISRMSISNTITTFNAERCVFNQIKDGYMAGFYCEYFNSNTLNILGFSSYNEQITMSALGNFSFSNNIFHSKNNVNRFININFSKCNKVGAVRSNSIDFDTSGWYYGFSNLDGKILNFENNTIEAINVTNKQDLYIASTPVDGRIIRKNNTLIRVSRTNKSFIYDIDEYMASGNITLGVLRSGTSAQRPTLITVDAGFQYYDTTLKKYICWSGTTWTNFDGTTL